MNIKEHIEQGHYPTDDKGRALVPMRGGLTATILATDHPGHDCIAGWFVSQDGTDKDITTWHPDGSWLQTEPMANDLLPPCPVTITAYAIVDKRGTILRLREDAPAGVAAGIERLVVLTGEIEEPQL